MKFSRRLFLTTTAALSLISAPIGVFAQDTFPSGPVEIVSHASAGGGTDATIRTLLPALEEALGVPVSVNIKTGGSGRVAMSYAKSKPADGHTIMIITPTHLYTMAQGNSPLAVDEVVGVARASDDPILIVAKNGGAFGTVEELLANEGSPVRWGTTHVGSVDHASAEVFAADSGVKISVVPFEGGGELVTNLMGGNIDIASLNLTEGMDAIERGDLTALAVMSPERVDTLPDTPTTAELGIDAEFATVRGFVTVTDVPEDVRATLETALLEAMQSERYQNLLKNSGMPMNSPAPAETWDRQLRNIHARGKQVLTDLGMVN